MKWSTLAERVHQSIKRNALLKESDRILLAVSGGMDSVVLLQLLLELQDHWKWELVVGHIDHGLRPGDDEKESELCHELAQTAGLKYLESKIDLTDKKINTEYRKFGSQNPSLESLARHARYAVFNDWAEKFKFDAICIGHHLNDQAETVLYRMLTGSGLKGLRGIHTARDKIKRPLMEIPKDEIIMYAGEKKLKYFNDPSNLNERFIRNRIRHKVIPLLKQHGFEDIDMMLASSALSIEEAYQALEYYVERAFKDLVIEKKDRFELPYEKLLDLPGFIQKQVLRLIFSEYVKITNHISEKQVAQLLLFIAEGSTGAATELLNCQIIKDRQMLVFMKNEGLREFGSIKIEEIETSSVLKLIPRHKNTAYFSYDLGHKDLILKAWEDGDSMTLFGSGKRKKVSDILKDEKVSALKKADHPVLLTGSEIVWIPGVKRSNLFKVKPGDKKMIQITYINMEQDND